ncbi:hypothetical protein E2C01_056936 [Portunus trituberculatus]|uniref:Uncharacterized protein n=1 Tax=Portunus trituberculatus TaxID=210409 RepID=A0A5B7GZ06_PORTR|nr:hypothetical protein [Portunus trituberculatus]
MHPGTEKVKVVKILDHKPSDLHRTLLVQIKSSNHT